MIILTPTEMEARPLREALPDVEIVVCGVGMAETAATTARLAQRGEELLLVGIAGSYDTSKHPVGSVVEVLSEQIEELPHQYASRYEVEPRWGLPPARSNSVNRSNAPHHTSEIENMEGATFMAVAQAMQLPHSQIRAISNLVGDPLERWSIPEALEALTVTLKKLLICD